MRGKYGSVLALSFSDRLAERGEAALALAAAGIRVFVAWALWSAVYATRSELGGMSLSTMVAYYAVAAASRSLDRSDAYAWEFAAEIRSGDFAKYLARPIDPLRYFLALSAGRSLFQACALAAAAAALSAALGAAWAIAASAGAGGPSGGAAQAALREIIAAALPDPLGLAAAAAVLALGLLALALLNFMTSLLAFRFPDITPFHMVKTNFVELLSGALIPLSLLPPWAQGALRLTPFPALASLPARLWSGQGLSELPEALAVLAIWDLVLAIAAAAVLKSLAARYEEAGS